MVLKMLIRFTFLSLNLSRAKRLLMPKMSDKKNNAKNIKTLGKLSSIMLKNSKAKKQNAAKK